MSLKIALGVFVAVVIGIAGFALFIPHANKGGEQSPHLEQSTMLPSVSLSDSYKKGIHTISGTVEAPTPCITLTADTSVASGTPDTISVMITMPADTGICLQVITDLPFNVTVAAGMDARIVALVNGVVASTTEH
jgi:hypothetical protein